MNFVTRQRLRAVAIGFNAVAEFILYLEIVCIASIIAAYCVAIVFAILCLTWLIPEPRAPTITEARLLLYGSLIPVACVHYCLIDRHLKRLRRCCAMVNHARRRWQLRPGVRVEFRWRKPLGFLSIVNRLH